MIKIKLGGKGSKKGVNYNKYVDSYFSDFATTGWPYILGGSNNFEGKQVVLLDEIASKPSKTKSLILDGKDFFYYFTGHTLSGTLDSVSLATLGDSYNKKDGSFDQSKDGRIKHVSTMVEISGLDISNAPEVRGDVHDVIYGLMGGEAGGGAAADPGALLAFINAEGHKVKGSKKKDVYAGTEFGDKIKGRGGNDKLSGEGGDDKIKGGGGNDDLRGGLGDDSLAGNKGKDAFIFDTAPGAGNLDRIKGFKVKDDTIALDGAVFAGLSGGKLDDSAFVTGSSAQDGSDRIIYDDDTGALSYDADGSGGADAVQFAELDKGLNLDADNFLII